MNETASRRAPRRLPLFTPALAACVIAFGSPPAAAQQDAAAPAGAAQTDQPQPNGQISFNFQDAPLDTVLTHMSDVLGLVIIKDAALDGRVTVISRQPLDMQEAVVILHSVLKDQGLAAVLTGRTLKIIRLDDAKKANIPVHVGADPDQIAETDEVITQVMPIKNVDAVRLRDDLNPLLSEYADATANQNSNSLIVTDTSQNIRRLAKIISALDTTTASVVDVRVYPLRYADAVEAARLINDIFGQRGTQGRGGVGGRGGINAQNIRQFFQQGGRGGRGGGPGGAGGLGTDQDGQGVNPLDVQVIASADQRTNNVVVGGPPETLDAVGRVLQDLDANPVSEMGVFTYFVRNGEAANIQQVLDNLFAGDNTGFGGFGGGRGGRGRVSNQRGGAANVVGGNAVGAPPGAAGFFNAFAGLNGATGASAADLIGQVYIEADDDTNSLLVMTNPKFFDQVRGIIEDLDRPVPQVLIKVLIAEVTHDNDIDLGVEFSFLNIDGGDVELFTDFGVAAQSGGLITRVLKSDLNATIRAMQEIGKLEVLSRPYILASDNQAATITVGSEVPFITNTRTTETGQTINTIQYEDVGIILNVTPHINQDGLVIMDVAPEISAVSGETVPISETVDAAVIEKRSATSRVGIRDSQTIVIGGLIEDQKTSTVSQVPLLGDIPILGNLFKRTEEKKTKTELLIFLTPHVALHSERLEEISAEEQSGVRIVPDAVEEGAYQRQIEGMNRGARPETERSNMYNGAAAPGGGSGTGAGPSLGADDSP